jgi:hypothetical protein
MKKTALVLSLSALTFYFYGKHGSSIAQSNFQPVALQNVENTQTNSQMENSPVQLHQAGMCQIDFRSLQKSLGKIDVGNYLIEPDTKIILIESLNHNVSVKGFNKMIDNFNSLYASDNIQLMKSYQFYADQNCKKIYGCIGVNSDEAYDWKIIKILPNPERCSYEPTITMSNVMLY